MPRTLDPLEAVQLALALIDGNRSNSSINQKYIDGKTSTVIDLMLWILTTKGHKRSEDEAYDVLDTVLSPKRGKNAGAKGVRGRTRPSDDEMESKYGEAYAQARGKSGVSVPKSKTRSDSKPEHKPETEPKTKPPREDDDSESDSDMSGDEDPDVGEDGENEVVFETGARYSGKGTGALDGIPDSVVNDPRIFTPLVVTKEEYENSEDFQAKKKPKTQEEPTSSVLNPKDYYNYVLPIPFEMERTPYTNADLGALESQSIAKILIKFSLVGAKDDLRYGKVDKLYHSIITIDNAEENRLTHIHAHQKTVRNVKNKISGGLLPFLLAVVGFPLRDVKRIWHVDAGRKHFLRNDILKSPNLKLFLRESLSVKNAKNAHGSPTLMYLFNAFAKKQGIPLKEFKPRVALDVLLIREFIQRLNEIHKAMEEGKEANDKGIGENIETIQNIGYAASLLYEVIGNESINLGGWSAVINTVIQNQNMRGELSKEYGTGDASDTGKNIIGLFILMSDDKTAQKHKSGHEHELEANKNPVIFNPVKMKYFSNVLQEEAQKKSNNSWKAAALLVEMHTGARITEVLAYADFYAFGEMNKEIQILQLEEIKKKVKSYSLEDIDNAVVQVGVLKRKAKSLLKPGEEYDVHVKETLPPKPVLWNLTAGDIKKLVFVVRDHVYEVIHTKYPDRLTEETRLNHLPPSLFKSLVGQVNSYLDKRIILGAIENLPTRKDGTQRSVTSHMLRRFYANYSFEHHSHGTVRNVWIMSVLGHDPKGLATSLSYTNATMKDPLAFLPVPQKGESLGIQAFNALQDIKYEMRVALAGYRDRPSDSPPLSHSHRSGKRKRNEVDDEKVVAVLIGTPAVVYHNMPARKAEKRISAGDADARSKKAAVVKEYVLKHCRFEKEGHFYLVKPNRATLLKSHFGNDYISAFLEIEAQLVKDWSDEYEGLI